ncbi:hypothetical protein V8G54_020896 [Vigna mungo]|uniref:Uncharacterized protein n=1 Tax=Vigna mungo TaxID=3915 RepID=A0AAQ3ND00_VIGMU
MQTGAEPHFVLFFDFPEEEMMKRVLSRNQISNIEAYISGSILMPFLTEFSRSVMTCSSDSNRVWGEVPKLRVSGHIGRLNTILLYFIANKMTFHLNTLRPFMRKRILDDVKGNLVVIIEIREFGCAVISVLGFAEPLCYGFKNLACWHRARTFTGGVIKCCCYWHRARTFTGIESLSSFVKYSEEVFILCEDSEEVFIPCGLHGNVNSQLRLTTGCRISMI